MSLFKTINHNKHTSIYVWKIEETFNELSENIILKESSKKRLLNMKSEIHQCGFLSVRHLLKEAGYNDFDLHYNKNGKPYLKTNKHISITHSFNFSAIIISNKEVGIDIEMNREKIKIIQHKFVNFENGFINPNDDLIKQLTVIWGAKESLYKIYPHGGLTFKHDIDIESFNLSDKTTKGYIKATNWNKKYCINFDQIENYTLVYALDDC